MKQTSKYHIVFIAQTFSWLLLLLMAFHIACAEETLIKKAESTPANKKKSDISLAPDILYPEPLLKKLKIDRNGILKHQGQFTKDHVHVEWMSHVHSILPHIDPEKENAIISIHLTLLYIKNQLNTTYLNGKISHQEFTNSIAELMKWFQKANQRVMSDEEHKNLFGISPKQGEAFIDQMTAQIPEYSFILNRNISVEEIKKIIPTHKLDQINILFRKIVAEQKKIGQQIEANALAPEQAQQAIQKSQQAFIDQCKEILAENEINIIFGSIQNLESGKMSDKPPNLSRIAEKQLGFPVENPEITIEMIREKIDNHTINRLAAFHQQRKQAIDDIDQILAAGDMDIDEAQKVTGKIQAGYIDQCREILTDEEFQLIFGNLPNH